MSTAPIAVEETRPATTPSLKRLLTVIPPCAILSLLAGLALRELGRQVLSVPGGLPTLELSVLLPATLAPVLGNSFGFFMSFIAKPGRHSLRIYLLVGTLFVIPPVVVAATKMPASANTGSIITTIAVNAVPQLIIPGLLALVPGWATTQSRG